MIQLNSGLQQQQQQQQHLDLSWDVAQRDGASAIAILPDGLLDASRSVAAGCGQHCKISEQQLGEDLSDLLAFLEDPGSESDFGNLGSDSDLMQSNLMQSDLMRSDSIRSDVQLLPAMPSGLSQILAATHDVESLANMLP